MASTTVRPHVPEEELHAYCDGELSPAQRIEIAEHLLGCLICRAQHAEVEAVRARATALLAIAVPATVRHAGRSATALQPPTRRRWPRVATAVAAALLGVGAWSLWMKPGTSLSGTSQLATSFGVSHLLGLGPQDPDTAGTRERQNAMITRVGALPQVTASPNAGPFAQNPAIGMPTMVDPVFTSDWTASTLDEALKVGSGSLARVSGVPVVGVRIHPSAIGGRPTFMVRQELPDGRPVWVFEGLEADIAPVNQILQASGIAMSMVTRTRPDYVGVGADLRVTTRMVTVVGYVPVDSLNALVSRLTLR